MEKTGLSFLLRILMLALALLGGLQLLALAAGTSPFLQAVLVTSACVVLTYKIATVDSRLVRARSRSRRRVAMPVPTPHEPAHAA